MTKALAALSMVAVSLAASLAANAGEIKGRVIAGGRGISGASASAMPYEPPLDVARRQARKSEEPKPLVAVTTGSDGAFALQLPPGTKPDALFQVSIEGGGVLASVLEGLYDASEVEDLGEITLAKGEKLAGRVVDSAGQPVAGASVTLTAGRDRSEDGPDRRRVPQTAKTGADGSFHLDGASSQGNTVEVEKEGLAPARVVNARSGAQPRAIVLSPGSELSGTVKRPDKKTAAAGALVRLEGAATTRWVEVAADGTFRLPTVPSGRGSLVVDGAEQGYALVADLKLPLARKLPVTLAAPASLEGRAVDAKTGRPVSRVKIQLVALSGERLTRSGPDGKYRLSPLPPGGWRLSADEPRYVPYAKELPLSVGETKKIDVPLVLGAAMSGRVTDEAGAPVAGAKGKLSKGDSTRRTMMRLLGFSGKPDFKTNPDGTFRATRLPPGENQLLALGHPEFEEATVAGLVLAPGATKTGVAVVMKRGVAVAGLVKDKDGNPIADADVDLRAAPGFRRGRGGAASISIVNGPGGRPPTKSGADGRFAVPGLPAGEYSLLVRKGGYSSETVDPVKVGSDAANEPIVVTLLPGAAIRGVVRSRGGMPLEGYVVVAHGPGQAGPLRGGGLRDLQPTASDGIFTLEGLRPGTAYDLQVFSGAGLGPLKKGVVAPADGVEVVVNGNGQIAGTATDGQTGKPLTSFAVSYEPDRGQGGGGGAGIALRFANRAAGGNLTGVGARKDVRAEDGAFLLDSVPAGKWQVVVEAKGYQTAHVASVLVEEGKTTPSVEVKVTPGATVRGRVTDARSGLPVPDATASVGAGGRANGLLALGGDGEGTVATDADGRFEIDGLAVGKTKLTVSHPDYAETSQSVDVKETGASVDLTLSKGGDIGGTVFSPAKQPLSNVTVALTAAGDAGFGRGAFGGSQTTITDPTGRFLFDHLTSGRYEVTASLLGTNSPPADVVLQAGESQENLAIVLQAGATIHAAVSGLPDAERSGVTVNAIGPDGFFGSSRTGTDGRADISGVPSGAITLRATAGDFLGSTRTASAVITVGDGQTDADAQIVFDSGYTLSGRVLQGNQPVTGANVIANGIGGGGRTATSRADDSGSYRLEGLQTGTYNVTASTLSGTGRKSQQVAIDSDQTLDLVIPLARLAGRVAEAGTHQPLSDAVVEVQSNDGPFLRSYRTDSNGAFAVEDLEPASYTLTVRKTDFLFEKRTATAAEQGGDDVVVELTRGEGVGVVVRDGLYGVPLQGAMARVLDNQKTPVFIGSVPLDANGEGEIPSIKPGVYTVTVGASGYAPQTLTSVNVPSPTVPIALTPGGSVEIHVGPETLAKGAAQALILGASGVPFPYSLFSTDGTIVLGAPVRRIENFVPGSYVLTVTNGASKPFTVAEGRTTIVELP